VRAGIISFRVTSYAADAAAGVDRVISFLRIAAGIAYLLAEAYLLPLVAAAKADVFLASYPHIGISPELLPLAAMAIAAALLLGPLGIAGYSPLSPRWWRKLIGAAVIGIAMYAVSGNFAQTQVDAFLSTHGYATCPSTGLVGTDGLPWHSGTKLWVRRNLYCPQAG
jgi:hypothetical protein